MANLLQLKKRITTAQNVSKTTRAMQLIAASKLKRAQNAALSSRPYIEKLASVSKRSIREIKGQESSLYLKKANSALPELLIVFAPDKGLCGSLVGSIISETLKYSDQNKNLKFVLVGNKLEKLALSHDILASFYLGTTLPSFGAIFPVLQIVDEYYKEEKVGKVTVLYPKFVSLFIQTPTITSLLPVEMTDEEEIKDEYTMFEPSAEEIVPSLLRHYLEISLFQFFIESFLSEQAARMISMKNATDNAVDVIEALKLDYNKTRQEKITNEILDIGAAALSQGL